MKPTLLGGEVNRVTSLLVREVLHCLKCRCACGEKGKVITINTSHCDLIVLTINQRVSDITDATAASK